VRASGPCGGAPRTGDAQRANVHDDAGIGSPPPDVNKAAWRTWARAVRRAWASDAQRRADDEAALQALLAAWGPWSDARQVLAYLAFADEPDPIDPRWRAGGALVPTLATTRTVGPSEPLGLHAWVEPFERHPFGFLQPRPDAPPVDPGAIELVLVPGLAFDVHGARLGHGLGHYDRLLPRIPGHVPRIGITLDALVVDRLPTEPHDAPMSHLLTPSGLRNVGGASNR